jgi:hypothetical protein
VTDSTPARSRRKATSQPDKPHKDFPLFCHKGSGYWAKKVRGKLEYFGKKSDDPKGEAALLLWLKHKDTITVTRNKSRMENGRLLLTGPA